MPFPTWFGLRDTPATAIRLHDRKSATESGILICAFCGISFWDGLRYIPQRVAAFRRMNHEAIPATIVAAQPMAVCHVKSIWENVRTSVIAANPQKNPMSASVWFVFGNRSPRKNVPSKPPYVNDAIFNPSSTTGFFVSVKSIAPPMRKIPQNNVQNRDQPISLFSVSALPQRDCLNRSRCVDEASELIDDDSVPMADASTPATTITASPVGNCSTINFGNTSSDVVRPIAWNVCPP